MAVKVAVAVNTLPTSNGSYVDFTVADFGTVDAAIILVSNANTGGSGNPQDNINFSIGFWTAAAQCCAAAFGVNGGTPETGRAASTADVALQYHITSGTPDTYAVLTEISAQSTDNGLRLTKDSGSSSVARYATVILFGGLTNKYVGNVSLGTGTDPINVTAPGFRADLVFAASIGASSSSTVSTSILSFGAAQIAASDTVAQGCLIYGADDEDLAADTATMVRDDAIAGQLIPGANAWNAAVGAHSSGFTIDPTANAGSDLVYYLAIELPDPEDAYVAIKDVATGSGGAAYTGAGFTPQTVILAATMVTGVNTETAGGSWAVGACDATTERTLGFHDEDAADPSAGTCYADTDNVLSLKSTAGAAEAVAAFSAFGSDGWTLSYSDYAASARKMLAIAIGNSVTAATLVVADGAHGHAADAVVLTQAHTLALADAAHAHATDAVTLNVGATLALADAAHAHTADALTLTQQHTLALADATHAHTADHIDLSQATILVVADTAHAHAADALSLVQAHVLTLADASHLHTADSLTLTQAHVLVVSDTAHGHAADTITLSSGLTLELADGAHAHAADVLTLTQAHVLVLQESSHAHSADVITLSEGLTIALADALHGHAADGSLTLTQDWLLAVSDALHAHAADNLDVTTQVTLIVSDALHAHYADVVRWQVPVTPSGRRVLIAASDRRIVILGS